MQGRSEIGRSITAARSHRAAARTIRWRAGDHLVSPGNRYRVQGDGLVLIGTVVGSPGRAVELAVTTFDEPEYAGASLIPGGRSLQGEFAQAAPGSAACAALP
jgi:hypothetical protein